MIRYVILHNLTQEMYVLAGVMQKGRYRGTKMCKNHLNLCEARSLPLIKAAVSWFDIVKAQIAKTSFVISQIQ